MEVILFILFVFLAGLIGYREGHKDGIKKIKKDIKKKKEFVVCAHPHLFKEGMVVEYYDGRGE